MAKEIRVLELFAGIGACSKAFTNLEIPHRIVDAVEIDKYAIKSFNAIHNTNFEPQDIKKWGKNIDVDLIMHGSPCQDFSVAGKQKGGDNGSGTRSSLLYESLRVIEKLKPKYVIWENVKNLASKKHKHILVDYCKRMESIGYSNNYQILNAKDYGIPQNRNRIFVVSILGREKFDFPNKKQLLTTMQDFIDNDVDNKYFLSEKTLASFTKENTGNYPRKERFLQNINKPDKTIANTITTRAGQRPTDNFVYRDGKLRKLTPKEIWRLMGFDENDVKKCSAIVSETQLYKQAGNSIVVNVVMSIIQKLFGGIYGETQNENI